MTPNTRRLATIAFRRPLPVDTGVIVDTGPLVTAALGAVMIVWASVIES